MVALIVVRRLVCDFKMDVSRLGQHSDQLFKLCSDAQWAHPNKRFLIVTSTGSVTAHQHLAQKDFSEPSVVFPIDAAVRELEQHLNEQERPSQLELSLPPMAVSKAVGGSR
ncbi:MAG: hypothetical protein K9J74_04260 [Sulfuritalea sp.]|nr:hypothetical protein [Sulfuritalea sp.]